MELLLLVVAALVALALIFDFTNGFQDAANSVATVVATKVLPAKYAPAFAAFFNFAAFFFVGTAVANTVAKVVKEGYVSPAVIFGALFGAIAWNVITWYRGIPSSASHAIIGGLVGAGLAAGGVAAVSWESVSKAAAGIVASPVVAISIAILAVYLITALQRWRSWHDDHPVFKGAQLVSAAALSFGHGANDAQKTMGVIAALLVGAGYTSVNPDGSILVPDWVAISAYLMIALGTLWGGWRVIETMGMKITKLHANTGAAANIGANVAVFGATTAGIPISTTHATATSVIGAGIGSKQGANWQVVRGMVTAWLITIPSTAAIGFIMYQLTQLTGVLAWISVGLVVILSGAWTVWAMLNTIGADDVAAEVDALDLTTDFAELGPDRGMAPATAADDAAAGNPVDDASAGNPDDELVKA